MAEDVNEEAVEETAEETTEEVSTETPDWRAGLPEDLSKVAERFNSPEDALRSIQELRKRESQVRVPGKDASPEERAAYLKAIGVPESPDAYEFPDLPEGEELTDEMKAGREAWGKRFHELGISKDVAKQLTTLLNEDRDKSLAAQVKADEEFVKSQDELLKAEWKGQDYEKNKTFANRAFAEIANRAGISIDEMSKIETKEGRLLLDDARMLKLFAIVGREMAEGSLGSTMTESEKETASEQLSELRQQISAAQAAGDSKKANRLYQKEQALIAKMDGDRPIVGVSRAA